MQKPKDNSGDPAQTDSEDAVWSGSFLFAIQTSITLTPALHNDHFVWE